MNIQTPFPFSPQSLLFVFFSVSFLLPKIEGARGKGKGNWRQIPTLGFSRSFHCNERREVVQPHPFTPLASWTDRYKKWVRDIVTSNCMFDKQTSHVASPNKIKLRPNGSVAFLLLLGSLNQLAGPESTSSKRALLHFSQQPVDQTGWQPELGLVP